MYPENLRYTKEHEWVFADGDAGTIGITDHAQQELGDIVYVDLPKVGTRIDAGKSLGSVESVKAVSDIYAPVSGEITEINESLADAPEKLNTDPHGDAWLVKIRLSNAEKIQHLMSAADYQSYVGAEKYLRYLPKSESERRAMLDACVASTPEELFAHLPEAVRLNRPLNLAPGISEYEIMDYFRDLGAGCATGYASFLGAGVYQHFRPVLVDTVVSRGEFLTSYTPYQAEIAQGPLPAISGFQTVLCQLTGMDVANASMYEGSTAVPEAAMMAARATGKGRVLVARSVHPEYREVLLTYAKNQGMPVEEFAYDPKTGALDLEDLERKMDDLTAAVIVQTPNFFGIADQVKEAARIAHGRGALLVVVFTEAVSLGILEPPAEADIVAGELQSFAISPSYGGPYAGIIAPREKYIRQMPGRLVGQSV